MATNIPSGDTEALLRQVVALATAPADLTQVPDNSIGHAIWKAGQLDKIRDMLTGQNRPSARPQPATEDTPLFDL